MGKAFQGFCLAIHAIPSDGNRGRSQAWRPDTEDQATSAAFDTDELEYSDAFSLVTFAPYSFKATAIGVETASELSLQTYQWQWSSPSSNEASEDRRRLCASIGHEGRDCFDIGDIGAG